MLDHVTSRFWEVTPWEEIGLRRSVRKEDPAVIRLHDAPEGGEGAQRYLSGSCGRVEMRHIRRGPTIPGGRLLTEPMERTPAQTVALET